MAVTKTKIGRLPDGRDVNRYSLSNSSHAEASFTDLGGIWLTMLVPDRSGAMRDVLCGADTVETLLVNPGHMGEPVGRNANRIGGAVFQINGKKYELGKNSDGINNLHSGPDFYRNRLWEAETGTDAEESYVCFRLHSPDGDQGFPGNAEISVTYTLTEDTALRIHYEAKADQDTVFNLTNHAYFNLNGHDSGDATDQIVWINADQFTVTDAHSIPTGELRTVEGTPLDFRKPKRISQDINADFDELNHAGGFDQNFCINAFDGQLRLAASAYAEQSGIKMQVMTDREGLQFYTANGMHNDRPGEPACKNGVHYGPRTSYCFETQHYPDAINHPEFPTSLVKSGDVYDTVTVYQFSVE